jgi:hypothetical protein
MSEDAASFRKRAEECQQQAERAISPLDKEAWLRLAEEWLKLALSALAASVTPWQRQRGPPDSDLTPLAAPLILRKCAAQIRND